MEIDERCIYLMKVCWTLCQVTKHSHATSLAYQSIRSIIPQISPYKNMSWRPISCPGYIYVDMASIQLHLCSGLSCRLQTP